jgi:hypothetical protein
VKASSLVNTSSLRKNVEVGAAYYVGWDVGGWNCDKNPRSRDAIVILDCARRICGTPWRGNLRTLINKAQTTADWIDGLFALCGFPSPDEERHVVLGIDTPLAFSTEFVALVQGGPPAAASIESSNENPYLYRATERFLFSHNLAPLSPIKDMIGSQATKGMHVLAKFAPVTERCGVWTDGMELTAFEAYPSPCRRSAHMAELRAGHDELGHADIEDALTCALLAWLLGERPSALEPPPAGTPRAEGWIWIPKDALE